MCTMFVFIKITTIWMDQKLHAITIHCLTNPGPWVALDVSSTEQQQPQPITTAASLRGRRDLLLKLVLLKDL